MLEVVRSWDTGEAISFAILAIGLLLYSWYLFCEVIEVKNRWLRLLLSLVVTFGGYHALIFIAQRV